MKLAADNLHGLDPIVVEAVNRLNGEPIKRMVKQFERDGADYIDVNPGRLSRKNEDRMAFLVETVQSATNLRLILDSPDPRLLEIGLGVFRGRPIISALSMEADKLGKILPLAKRHDAELVILLMDENCFTPPTADEKIALALELRSICIDAGLNSEDLIFDPVLPNMTWHDAMFRIGEVIRTVRLLASGAVFQDPVRTMSGLSNIRSGVKKHYPVDLEVLTMAALAGAGLEILLASAKTKEIVDQVALLKMMTCV